MTLSTLTFLTIRMHLECIIGQDSEASTQIKAVVGEGGVFGDFTPKIFYSL